MAATAGYQAGVEANSTRISYAAEATWGVLPAVAFKAIRYMSETLAETKTRQRPSEINQTREASQAVTTQQTAAGTITYALSYATYDDFFSIVLGSDWGVTQTINGIAGDITLTNTAGTVVLSSTLSTKFAAIPQGSWIRLNGFTNALNNGWWYVKIHTDDNHLTLEGTNRTSVVTETPALTAAHVRARNIRNGITFKSIYMQQMLSAAMFLIYPGAYVSRMTLSGGIGQFFTGSIDIMSQQEDNVTSDSSTGLVTAAPTAIVMDPVNGFVGAFWNGVPMVGTLTQMSITLENAAAAPEYGMGNQLSVGMLAGTFTASGSFSMYFNDFTNYALFQAETQGVLTFIVQGSTGNSYALTFLNAFLMVKAPITGPGTAVMAEITVEGNPILGSSGTFQIDQMANT